jgi:hypothetical protein
VDLPTTCATAQPSSVHHVYHAMAQARVQEQSLATKMARSAGRVEQKATVARTAELTAARAAGDALRKAPGSAKHCRPAKRMTQSAVLPHGRYSPTSVQRFLCSSGSGSLGQQDPTAPVGAGSFARGRAPRAATRVRVAAGLRLAGSGNNAATAGGGWHAGRGGRGNNAAARGTRRPLSDDGGKSENSEVPLSSPSKLSESEACASDAEGDGIRDNLASGNGPGAGPSRATISPACSTLRSCATTRTAPIYVANAGVASTLPSTFIVTQPLQ